MSTPRITTKLVLRTSKTRADGKVPVYLRITANRKTRMRSTGIYVEPKHWNGRRGEVRASHDISDALNAKLRDLLLEAQQHALDASSAEAVVSELDGGAGSLTGYFERFIASLEEKGAHWEWKKYRTTLAKLQGCLGKELSWDAVGREQLVRFECYLRSVRKNSPNTVHKELTRLRRVYKQAIRDGALKPAQDPFLVYEKPKRQRIERRKLTLEEVERLAALGKEDGLQPGSVNVLARDVFVFAFYAVGMRFGDVALLKGDSIKGDRVEYRMMKTGTPMSVPLSEPALRIADVYADADTYLFPLLKKGDERDSVHLRRRIASRNAQINAALKRVARLAGLEPEGLSMHVARHSFADYARRQGGNLYAISKSLGHSNLQTTETYLKSFDRDAVDGLADQLWGKKSTQKHDG
ncbi:MAG: site-specific integrase [Bacteroidota bacterium]